jgi:hypothetical protein
VFGLYPYSYASAVPFMLSGISQLSGLEMEITVLIFDVFVGLFSIFAAYLLAGMVRDDDRFKFFVAFGCSTAQGMLVFTTWDVSTRGLFIVMLPLFVYLVLKVQVDKLRAGIFVMILFVLMAAMHHYVYFTFPIIASFIIIVVATKINKSKIFQRYYVKKSIINIDPSTTGYNISTKFKNQVFNPIKGNLLNICYLVLFFIALLFPFFGHAFITAGSRYGWVLDMFIINMRYTGPLFLFAFGGFTYLVLKRDKTPEDWFLLVIFLFIIPFSYIHTYTHFILFTFLFLFIGVSFTNIAHAPNPRIKYAYTVIIASLLIAVIFSGFYQHWHTGMKEGRGDWRMTDETYVGGKWIKEGISTNKCWISNTVIGYRMFAVSGGLPPLVCGEASGISYGFVNISSIKIIANSPLSISFYWDNPYVVPLGYSVEGKLSWLFDLNDIDGTGAKAIIKQYNISYIIEGRDRYPLLESVHIKKEKVYDSGTIKIWLLNKD